MKAQRHQYVERETGKLIDERPYWDAAIHFLYSSLRENAPVLFRAVTSERMSSLLGFVNYDLFIGGKMAGHQKFLKASGIDLREALDDPEHLSTLRDIFQRKIRYWDCRPMPEDEKAVLSPADAKLLIGSFCETSNLFVKGKFFDYGELLRHDKADWLSAFREGAFAIFRLTPDKYHYNHTPVAGRVVDFYEIQGSHHSCNPDAVVSVVTPYSKNTRVVTIIDTDVDGGTGAGLVAMIEVVALMIGRVVQCYSEEAYERPVPLRRGQFLKRGVPKSLYRPGSSTDILIFQKDRICFSEDIVRNLRCRSAESRFTRGFRQPLVETDVKVRSAIGQALTDSKIDQKRNDEPI